LLSGVQKPVLYCICLVNLRTNNNVYFSQDFIPASTKAAVPSLSCYLIESRLPP
jgi:hypothetical protein